MSLEAIASRYAQALFEIGIEKQNLPRLAEQTAAFAQAYSDSPELRVVLTSPLVSEHDRSAILDQIAAGLGVDPVVHNTVRLLAERHRAMVLPALARALLSMSDERAGLTRAEVTSARPLADDYARRLQTQLESLTGKKVVLQRKIDPTILGGVIARVGDRIIDGSVKSRLTDLTSRLLSV